jgi:hypothetical protein
VGAAVVERPDSLAEAEAEPDGGGDRHGEGGEADGRAHGATS